MKSAASEPVAALRRLAGEASVFAHTPYSRRSEAVILLLSDGSWIPGVRVESASFSITIPPLLNALTTAVALSRSDIVAAAMSRPLEDVERAYVASAPFLERLTFQAPDFFSSEPADLPKPAEALSPYIDAGASLEAEAAISLARDMAGRAHVPESRFPVGCVLELDHGRYVPGANVEHPDWLHILCAERNALGTCVSYGYKDPRAVYLTCLLDPLGTPCGACRQLLVELAPSATLWMDRGDSPPVSSDPRTMLPASFRERSSLSGTSREGSR